MLRTITELVPFGQDDYARRISAMYLGNVGATDNGKKVTFNYVIGYFEKPSQFARDGVCQFKFLKDYDRNQSTFNLMKAIYNKKDWMNEEQFLEVDYHDISRIVSIMFERAKQDLDWNGNE